MQDSGVQGHTVVLILVLTLVHLWCAAQSYTSANWSSNTVWNQDGLYANVRAETALRFFWTSHTFSHQVKGHQETRVGAACAGWVAGVPEQL